MTVNHEVEEVLKEEVRAATKRIKSKKPVDSHDV